MKRLVGIVCLLLVSGCSGISVSVDYDPAARFEGVARYAWVEPEHSQKVERIHNSALFARRVQVAIDRVLQQRGLVPVKARAQADLLVTFHLGLEQRLDVKTYGGLLGWRDCIHCAGFALDTQVVVNDYQQSLLAIDLLLPQGPTLVWRGVAERRAEAFDQPARYEAYVAETVEAILAKLPPALGRPLLPAGPRGAAVRD